MSEKWIKIEILFSKTDESVFIFGCETARTIHSTGGNHLASLPRVSVLGKRSLQGVQSVCTVRSLT